jgi:hypothetical protein
MQKAISFADETLKTWLADSPEDEAETRRTHSQIPPAARRTHPQSESTQRQDQVPKQEATSKDDSQTASNSASARPGANPPAPSQEEIEFGRLAARALIRELAAAVT